MHAVHPVAKGKILLHEFKKFRNFRVEIEGEVKKPNGSKNRQFF